MRGKFITFEGGEGTGKSTHAAMLATTLAERLTARGFKVVLTREHGHSAGAEIIHHILHSGMTKPLGAETESILLAAARNDHVKTTIAPALDAGNWVICDGFIDTARARQGALGQVDMKLIRGLDRLTVGTVRPDLTFVLDVPANIAMARATIREPGTEAIAKHEELRRALLVLAEREPDRMIVVDAGAPRDVVMKRLWATVEERLLGGRPRENAAP